MKEWMSIYSRRATKQLFTKNKVKMMNERQGSTKNVHTQE